MTILYNGSTTLPPNLTARTGADGVVTINYGKAIASAEEAINLAPFAMAINGESVAFPYMLFRTRYRHRTQHIAIIRAPAQIIAERLMLPFGDTGAQTYAVVAPPYAGPTDLSSITPGMPNTGGRPDIGLVTDVSAAFMLTGSYLAMLAWAQAASSEPMFFMDTATGMPIDLIKYPKANNYWLENRQGEPWMRGVSPEPYHTGLSLDTGHWPEMSYMGYVATGDLSFLEDLQYAANYAIHSDAYWSNVTDGAMLSPGQTRSWAWGIRNLAMAWRATVDAETRGVLPPTCHPSGYWRTLLTQSRGLIEKQYMAAPERQVTRSISGAGEPPTQAFAPWQMDYLLQVLAFVLLVGLDDFKPLYVWAFGNVIWRTNGTSGWPVAWSGYWLLWEGFDSIQALAENAMDTLLTPEQAEALRADPYNGGKPLYDGEYNMLTRAALVAGLYLQDKGIVDLKATYPEIETCFINSDRMARNYNQMDPRTALVRDPSQAPAEIPPLPEPEPQPPAGGITVSGPFELEVGQAGVLTVTPTGGKLKDGTTPSWDNADDTVVSVLPAAGGLSASVTGLKEGTSKITIMAEGASVLTNEVEMIVTSPLATGLEVSFALSSASS